MSKYIRPQTVLNGLVLLTIIGQVAGTHLSGCIEFDCKDLKEDTGGYLPSFFRNRKIEYTTIFRIMHTGQLDVGEAIPNSRSVYYTDKFFVCGLQFHVMNNPANELEKFLIARLTSDDSKGRECCIKIATRSNDGCCSCSQPEQMGLQFLRFLIRKEDLDVKLQHSSTDQEKIKALLFKEEEMTFNEFSPLFDLMDVEATTVVAEVSDPVSEPTYWTGIVSEKWKCFPVEMWDSSKPGPYRANIEHKAIFRIKKSNEWLFPSQVKLEMESSTSKNLFAKIMFPRGRKNTVEWTIKIANRRRHNCFDKVNDQALRFLRFLIGDSIVQLVTGLYKSEEILSFMKLHELDKMKHNSIPNDNRPSTRKDAHRKEKHANSVAALSLGGQVHVIRLPDLPEEKDNPNTKKE